ncbi:MAG: hypothetical protein HOP19_06280, partial [Acidobacteria bacterium]|nr:hypothetical protein [Acidobacteriota bacterium]
MLLNVEDDKLIRRYLLGDLQRQPELLEAVEHRLLAEDDFIAHCDLVEAELIEAYAGGILSRSEREAFERYFLLTPQRRGQLALTIAMQHYAAQRTPTEKPDPNALRPPWNWWGRGTPLRWQFVTAVLLACAVGIGAWRFYFALSPIDRGRQQLAQAFPHERPIEARLAGFNYAPYVPPVQLKGGREEAPGQDVVALDRAKQLLLGGEAKRSDPQYLHALGQYYVTQKEFDKAILQLREGKSLAPQVAKLHADLGAALIGKIERDRLAEAEPRKEDVDECLAALNQALTL